MHIYIHIPFCKNICSYCDFCKIYYNKKYINNYLDALEKEIKTRYNNEIVKTIYIGGGTPTSLDYDELERLLEITNIFNKDKKLEFSIESNIEIDNEKIKLLKKYNVNRISLGVQSFDDKILKILNRTHNKEDVLNTIKLLKENGLSNINIDLIYGVTDNIDIIKKDIDLFLSLDIPHISCYSLIIENNTILKINNYHNINEEVEYDMYKYIEEKLLEKNYHHYEVSNYAKKGYESIHNMCYWKNKEYYGFGLSSVSYIKNRRITNTKNIDNYIKGIFIKETHTEDELEQMENDIILGLRLIDGIDILEFEKKYNKKIKDIFNINSYLENGMLNILDNKLKINKNYIYLSNEILTNILN